jgi:hypothetical protein
MIGPRAHIGVMKNLGLSDAEAEALLRELSQIIEYDRYPLSPRIRTLKEILGKLRPEPTRPAASPAPRVYAPPCFIRGRRRRG